MRAFWPVAALSAALCATQAAAQAAGGAPRDAPRAEAVPSAPVGPLAGFGWFAELAGSCWKGEHPDGKTSDTQCSLAQYERLRRGSI
jgi:hypothetical protein